VTALLAGLRQTDEWPLLKKQLGSFQDVPRRQIAAGRRESPTWVKGALERFRKRSGGEGPVPGAREKRLFPDEDAGLSSGEKMVYNLVDGKRNIGQIVNDSSLGEYSTCRALLALRERGWIWIDGAPARKRSAGGDTGRAGLGKWVSAGAALVLCFLAVAVMRPAGTSSWVQGWFGEETRPVYRLLNRGQRERVVRAVELYREEYGNVPMRLSDLVRAHLIEADDLSLWGDNVYAYTPDSSGEFRLLIVPAR